MGEPARAAMLPALLDGRALPAGELAAIARVSAPTASAHLARLVDGGLVRARPLGRHRYFELAGPDVADAIESLQRLGPRRPVTSYAQSATARRLAEARSWTERRPHLAGALGAHVLEVLLAAGWVARVAGDRSLRVNDEFRAVPEV